MTQFCDDKGIKRKYIIARTPQQNRVAERRNKTLIKAGRTMALVTKPHNKTSYELIRGRPPLIDFMKLFGCHVTILNTRDNLGKFEGKADEGYFVGFQENVPNVKGNRPYWLFDIDSLTISMNYVPVVTGNQTNGIAGTKEKLIASQDEKKKELEQEYILIPICTTGPLISRDAKDSAEDAGKKAPEVDACEASDNVGQDNLISRNTSYAPPEATKFLKDHPHEQVIGSLETPVQTRHMAKTHEEFGLLSLVYKLRRTNHKDFQNCLFACFLSQMETKKPVQALQDPKEEVYFYQPPGFEDLNFPDKVYKMEKALYGLHQAPRTCHCAAEFIPSSGFSTKELKNGVNQELPLGDDAEGTACLPNEEIFEGLARMSNTMASTIICLADNQKFNLSKYIFDHMVKSLEGRIKFYLFLRFLQIFLDNQVEGMTRRKEMYVISSHTKKIFANMKRIGAGFSRVVTHLFDTMMVQVAVDMGDTPVETHQQPIVHQPSTFRPQKQQKPRRKQRKEVEVSPDESEDEDNVPIPSSNPLPSGEDSYTLNELMVFCTSLQE
nr:hypothetical protein [Tanacetum cinerariifolium]